VTPASEPWELKGNYASWCDFRRRSQSVRSLLQQLNSVAAGIADLAKQPFLGDLNGAQAAFGTLQQLNQSLATASGNSLSSNSQLSTDLTALGSALTAGDLSTAQSAFATVQSDLKNSNSPSQTNETNAAAQSVQLVHDLLSTLNSDGSSSNTSDSTASLLESVYGSSGGLNVMG
jgi:hypothetical protein